MSKSKELSQYIDEVSNTDFLGWNFSHIDERYTSKGTSWSYFEKLSPYMEKAHCMLDMGTGGGELLSSFPFLPPKTYATEGYPPNLKIAQKNLEGKGIKVVSVPNSEKDLFLPFEDEKFDLIINRHESFFGVEVARILRTGGFFITQQVGGQDLRGLNLELGDKSGGLYSNWNLSSALNSLDDYFSILESFEEYPQTQFKDIGAIIYYLKACPWQVEGFSIDQYKDRLEKLHNKINRGEKTDFKEHRFFIIARKN